MRRQRMDCYDGPVLPSKMMQTEGREVNTMACKPMVVVSYEYPLSPEGSKHFLSQTERWIREALANPGAVEFRTLRTPDQTVH